MKNELFQLKISLKDSKPIIWRRIIVPSDFTFLELHSAIQSSMGWLEFHQHEFEIIDPKTSQKIRVGTPDPEFDYPEDNLILENKVKLSDYLNDSNSRARYEYDFGDYWIHTIELEKIFQGELGEIYPKCIGGKMECPPEDCGGMPGYFNLLRIMNNPKDEEYEEMMEWVGGEFDPEYFEADDVEFDELIKKRLH